MRSHIPTYDRVGRPAGPHVYAVRLANQPHADRTCLHVIIHNQEYIIKEGRVSHSHQTLRRDGTLVRYSPLFYYILLVVYNYSVFESRQAWHLYVLCVCICGKQECADNICQIPTYTPPAPAISMVFDLKQ